MEKNLFILINQYFNSLFIISLQNSPYTNEVKGVDMKFQKLTPINTDETKNQNKVYKEAFDAVFLDKNIRNIAVSGPYGAGKSSVFKTYMETSKKNETTINISLAHFEQCDEPDKNIEKFLETEIINQLIHQISTCRIRKTRFHANFNENWPIQLIKTILLSLTIIVFFLLIFHNFFIELFSKTSYIQIKNLVDNLFSSNGFLILSAFLMIMVFWGVTYIVLRSRGDFFVKKINLKDVGVELGDSKNHSFFDDYLSEIRYLFDNCGSHIIVFEDIDRIETCTIFERIKELNTIVNFGKKDPIRFFYILKDDIFSSKIRTKIFDFIIPVIPIVDSSNSYSKLLEYLQKGGKEYDIDTWFLRGLSVYIDDMRLLKNIINEFQIYFHQLFNQNLNPTRLLGIITYKNLFPKDFNDWQSGCGYLYELIKSFDLLKEHIVEEELKEVQVLDDKIIASTKEHLKNVDELSALFIAPIGGIESVNRQNIESFSTQLDLFIEMQKSPESIHFLGSQNIQYIKQKFDKLQKNPEYMGRLEVLNAGQKKHIEQLELSKQRILSKIQEIRETTLVSKIVNDNNIGYYLDLPQKNDQNQKIRNDPYFEVVSYLVRKEMIDGNYEDYLTYYYDNELNFQDRNFINSISVMKPLSKTYSLSNPYIVSKILASINEYNESYLNKDLFFYTFNEGDRTNCERYICLSKRFGCFKIIIDYLWEGKNLPLLIRLVNRFWETFYSDVNNNPSWSINTKARFLQLVLIYEESEIIRSINNYNDLITDIEKDEFLFVMLPVDVKDPIINNLNALGIKVKDLSEKEIPDDYLLDIYKNNLYELSFQNICFWLRKIYHCKDVHENNLISAILSKAEEPLSKYAFSYFDNILNDLFSSNPEIKFIDHDSTIITILNSSLITDETKNTYITKLDVKIGMITDITDLKNIEKVIEKDKIVFSMNNLLGVYIKSNETLSPIFIDYLGRHEDTPIDGRNIDATIFSEEHKKGFFKSIITESNLNLKITEKLIAPINLKYSSIDNIINNDKALALIRTNKLTFNTNNLNYIRNNYPELICEFEKRNLSAFKKMVDTGFEVNSNEIVKLLESDLNGTEQKSLLSHIKIKIPYKETYRFRGVKIYIIQHLLDLVDLELAINDSKAEEDEIVPYLLDLILKNIDYIVQNEIVIPEYQFRTLASMTNLQNNQKVILFSISIHKYSGRFIMEIIKQLKIHPFVEVFNGKHPKFIDGIENRRILTALLNLGLLTYIKNKNRLYPRGLKRKE